MFKIEQEHKIREIQEDIEKYKMKYEYRYEFVKSIKNYQKRKKKS